MNKYIFFSIIPEKNKLPSVNLALFKYLIGLQVGYTVCS